MALLAAHQAGVPLGGQLADAAALTTILVLGLPHGALDLFVFRSDPRIVHGRLAILGAYLVIAATMASVWLASPPVALALFLVVAIVHFAVEMRPEMPSAVAWSLACLLIALPCASHPEAVSAIFSGLAADGIAGASLVATAGALATPLLPLLALAAAVLPTRRAALVEAAVTITALALLPPLPAFAVFFCLIHAPRHFAGAARSLGVSQARAAVLAAPATLAALGFGLILTKVPGFVRTPPTATFLLISILTVPHMLAGPFLRWLGEVRPGRSERGEAVLPRPS